MPDARQPGRPAPDDWGQAFAALPLETPPAGGWNRVAAALPARRSRSRVWIPAAVAACLALAVVVPWRGATPDQSPPVVASVPPAATPSITPSERTPATSVAAATPAATPADRSLDAVGDGKRAASISTDAPASPDTGLAVTPVRAPRDKKAPARPAPASGSSGTNLLDAGPSVATTGAKDAAAPVRQATGAGDTPASPAMLETLYTESARLEALLSQIRDDRVASGPAMALSTALNERVAGIDVALSQPDLAADTRVGLWRERVAVLQRLAGVESTQRWMAANGYPTDGAVAQVY